MHYPILEVEKNNAVLKVETGSIAPINFIVKNSGREDLILEDISTSCGCITPKSSGMVISPGEAKNIELIFRDVDGEGHRKYEIVARTNDKNNPVLLLSADVYVQDEISIIFDKDYVNSDDEQNNTPVNFRVENNSDKQLSLQECKASVNWLGFKFPRLEAEISGKIIIMDSPPSGNSDVLISFSFLQDGQKVIKIVRFPVANNRGSINCAKPFTMGVVKGEKSYHTKIKINGLLPHFKVRYEGEKFCKNTTRIDSDGLVDLTLSFPDDMEGYLYRGHIFVVDGITDQTVYSHPVYVNCFRY